MEDRSSGKLKFVLGFAAFFIALWFLWNTAFVYPLKIFVVLLHEISHAVASVLTGGGIEKMDDGFKMVLQMRRKQMIEYAHRAKVVGLDRSERMAPELKELLGE